MNDNRPDATKQAIALIKLDIVDEDIATITGLTLEAVQQLRETMNEDNHE
ncbi:hypothetical protein KYT24_004376 [Salmonella enterica]|nr:hypothetical protein [Salmonella enterica]